MHIPHPDPTPWIRPWPYATETIKGVLHISVRLARLQTLIWPPCVVLARGKLEFIKHCPSNFHQDKVHDRKMHVAIRERGASPPRRWYG